MAEGGTKRLRGKSWQFRAHVNGRRVATTVPPENGHAVGEKRAEQMLRRWVTKMEQEHRTSPVGTLAELWAKWWRHAEPNWKPGTGDSWDSYWRNHIEPALGDRQVEKITTEDIDELYASLRKKLAPASILKVHTPLRMCFEQAVTWGHVLRNPVAKATPPTVPKKAMRVPANDQVLALIALAEDTNPDFMCYLHVAVDTGARRSMVVGLRWDSVDLVKGEMVFQAAAVYKKGVGTIVLPTTKSDNEWRVSLHPSTVDRLKDHQARARERAELVGVAWSDEMFVFTSDPAGTEPWAVQSPTQAFGRLRTRAKLPNVRLHDLRHFMATTWLAAGEGQATVMGRGGWTDLRSFERYTHFVAARDKAASKRIGDQVFGRTTKRTPTRKPRRKVTRPS